MPVVMVVGLGWAAISSTGPFDKLRAASSGVEMLGASPEKINIQGVL